MTNLTLTVAQLRTLRNANRSKALCEERLDALTAVVGGEDAPFSALEMALSWEHIDEIVQCYQALVNTGLLPDTGLIWQIARLAFAVTPKRFGLRHWAETLSAENWEKARDAAEAIPAIAVVHAASDASAVYAAYDAAYCAAHATTRATYADRVANDAAYANATIRAMVVAELEAVR